MGLYEELREIDVLGPIAPQLERGIYKIEEVDGKPRITGNTVVKIGKRWIDAKFCPERECANWLYVYFKYYRIIPRGCRNCWKVVFRPKNLKEAFEVLDLQRKQGFPSKTGIEERPHSGNQGGWSSFWYAPLRGGLAGGRRLHRTVQRDLKQRFGRGAVLKRGCTEMERHTFQSGLGKSDEWEKGAEFFDKKEALLATVWRLNKVKMESPPPMQVAYITMKWIEHAAEFGDASHLDYCDGPLLEGLMNYEKSVHSERDFVSTWDRPENGHPKGEGDKDGRIRLVGSGEETEEELDQSAGDTSEAKPSAGRPKLDERGSSGERSDGGPLISDF